MRNLKSLIPVLFTAFVFTGCNTDDLRNDIDELKNRVESLEAQVSAINENMNALQVLVEGKKIIQECSYNEETKTWTLVLSDGSTLQLYQGEDGVANTPKITIDDTDNTWVVDGVDTNVPATGNNATVPVFSVDTNGYWMVDYDGEGGEAPKRIKDSEGNDVLAKPTDGSGTGGDTFFESVKINGDFLEVKLTATGQTYSLPIVPELLCEINIDGVEGYKNEVLTVGYGMNVKIPVKIKGDNYFVTAPSGWIAQLSELSGENATITLTAPAEPSTTIGSRATADNTTDLTLQVNKGAYWAVSKIKLNAISIISSYYELFNSGETINIAGLELKKSDFSEDENFVIMPISKEGNNTDLNKITKNGVYFIQPEAIAVFDANIDINDMYIIRDNSFDNSAKLQVNQHFHLKGNESSKFLCEGLTFDFSLNNIYAFNIYGDFGDLIFKNCLIKTYLGQPIFYTGTDYNLKNIVFDSCKIDVTGRTQRQLFNIQKLKVGSISLKNNVVYSTGNTDVVIQFFNMGNTVSSPILSNFTMENNTFYQAVPETYGIVTCKAYENISIQKNLLYSSEYKQYHIILKFYDDKNVATSGSGVTLNNYSNTGGKAWKIYNQNDVLSGSEQVKKVDDMFISKDPDNAIYIPKEELKDYGAKFE